MPIYEYRCEHCGKEFQQLFLNLKKIDRVTCKYCNGSNVTRLVSSFSVHQTEAARLSNFDTSKPQGEDFYRDSRNIGLWAKKKMKELGVDIGPKLDEIVEKGRTGKILEEYSK